MTKKSSRNESHVHACLANLTVENDNLVFAGQTVLQLAEIAGQTPFYAYDRSRMTSRVKELRDTLPDFVRLHFAMKANPHPVAVNHLANLVDGLDVASAGELHVALASGIQPGLISADALKSALPCVNSVPKLVLEMCAGMPQLQHNSCAVPCLFHSV